MLHQMNEESRQLIKTVMAEQGLSQERLAERINERRKDSKDSRRKPSVDRHTISRAISKAGDLPPILEDILEELGLEAVLIRKK